jgi:hypothetical protein
LCTASRTTLSSNLSTRRTICLVLSGTAFVSPVVKDFEQKIEALEKNTVITLDNEEKAVVHI